MGVPVFELRQHSGQFRLRVGISDSLGEVIACHGLAIVALKIQLHAAGKACAV